MRGVFTTVLFCFLAAGNAWGSVEPNNTQTPPAPELQQTESVDLDELLKTYFTYQREDRSDPFKTFIKKEVPLRTKPGEPEEVEILTGMQLFEPGQLQLVSIIFSENRALAMLQDSVGQGYIVEKGTKIGRRGVIEDIIPNAVLIKQWSVTFAGQKKYKTIEMVLRKEGE